MRNMKENLKAVSSSKKEQNTTGNKTAHSIWQSSLWLTFVITIPIEWWVEDKLQRIKELNGDEKDIEA